MPILIVLLHGCSVPSANEKTGSGTIDHVAVAERDLLSFDLVQHTCALYVSVRSSSLRKPAAFGEETTADLVRWKCDDGNKLACVRPPIDPVTTDPRQVIQLPH